MVLSFAVFIADEAAALASLALERSGNDGQCLIVREGQLTYRYEPITHIGSSHD